MKKGNLRHWSDYPIKKTTLDDSSYPSLLKKIKNPPKKLYFRGELTPHLFSPSLAIVGSRRITQYGRGVIRQLMPDLVTEKVTIISGFMYGVDSVAHQECLELGGKTVAVLGYGLNILYPKENDFLYSLILARGGAVISEYPAGFKGKLWTFPQRNRIIVGLASLGVLIIEAGEKSGSLITAKIARKEKRKVFAVPGPITSTLSRGTNLLLKEKKAQMVLAAEDILERKTKKASREKTSLSLNENEREIIDLLKEQPLTADEIARKLNKEITAINQLLTLLGLKKLIEERSGRWFSL